MVYVIITCFFFLVTEKFSFCKAEKFKLIWMVIYLKPGWKFVEHVPKAWRENSSRKYIFNSGWMEEIMWCAHWSWALNHTVGLDRMNAGGSGEQVKLVNAALKWQLRGIVLLWTATGWLVTKHHTDITVAEVYSHSQLTEINELICINA